MDRSIRINGAELKRAEINHEGEAHGERSERKELHLQNSGMAEVFQQLQLRWSEEAALSQKRKLLSSLQPPRELRGVIGTAERS